MSQESHPKGAMKEAASLLMEARVFAYDLLRQFYLREMEMKLYAFLRDEHVVRGFPFADEHELIREGLEQATNYLDSPALSMEEAYDKVHWDFTRLFIGPEAPLAPPWESAYLSEYKLLFQKQTMEVRRIYRKYEFLPANYPHEADDHLGLEMEFMFHLAAQAKAALDEGNLEQASEQLKEQALFLEEHLLKWIPKLVEDILKSAETDFHRGMAKVLQGFLEVDHQAIAELLQAVENERVIC